MFRWITTLGQMELGVPGTSSICLMVRCSTGAGHLVTFSIAGRSHGMRRYSGGSKILQVRRSKLGHLKHALPLGTSKRRRGWASTIGAVGLAGDRTTRS